MKLEGKRGAYGSDPFSICLYHALSGILPGSGCKREEVNEFVLEMKCTED